MALGYWAQCILLPLSALCLFILVGFYTPIGYKQMKVFLEQRKQGQILNHSTHLSNFLTAMATLFMIPQALLLLKKFAKLVDYRSFDDSPLSHYHFYLANKLFQYWIFLTRLKVAYDGSPYEYSELRLKIAGFLCLCLNIAIAIVFKPSLSLRVDGYLPYSSMTPGSSDKVQLILSICGDLIITISCLFAFLIPIKKIMKMGQDARAFTQSKFKSLAAKYTILTFAAAGSSFLTYLLSGGLKTGDFIPFDTVVNMSCLYLMMKQNEGLYKKLCCGPLSYYNRKDREYQSRIETGTSRTQDTTATTTTTTTTTNNTTTSKKLPKRETVASQDIVYDH